LFPHTSTWPVARPTQKQEHNVTKITGKNRPGREREFIFMRWHAFGCRGLFIMTDFIPTSETTVEEESVVISFRAKPSAKLHKKVL
jgi:hypothetical protein